jgi:diguanylate cyclase (GGDEF)-like protein
MEETPRELIDQPEASEWSSSRDLSKENADVIMGREEANKVREDYLTSLLNRRGGEEEIQKLIDRRKRVGYYDNKIDGFMVIDLDKFKPINDNYGHNIGDEVLKKTAEFLKKEFRQTDTIYRYGGEEFIIIMKDVDVEEIKRIKNKLGFLLELDTTTTDGDILKIKKSITFSGGFVSFNALTDSWEDKIKKADRLLYTAKETGRDQIIFEKN